MVLFSSKLDALRARSWDPHISLTDLTNLRRWQTSCCSFQWDDARQFYCQTDLSYRLYWRCSSFFWAANAIIPLVNHHYFATAFCMIIAIDCLFWSLSAKSCRAWSQDIQLDAELSPQLVAVFNAKQVYVWLLLFVHVSKSLVRSAVSDIEANLTIRFDIAYLLAFMMVLHCFKSAILTFTILKQAFVRLLLQLCLLAGLLLFSVATFQSNGGLHASESSTTLLMLSTACLLLPELVADGVLLSSEAVEGACVRDEGGGDEDELGARLLGGSDDASTSTAVVGAEDKTQRPAPQAHGTRSTLTTVLLLAYVVALVALAVAAAMTLRKTLSAAPGYAGSGY